MRVFISEAIEKKFKTQFYSVPDEIFNVVKNRFKSEK